VAPKDNLKQPGEALFEAFGHSAAGHPPDEVISAAMNIVLNVVRQRTSRRSSAIAAMDELFGRSMDALMQHYDGTTDRRRSVIPFDQVVTVPHTRFQTKFGHLGRKNGHT
jgi:hypothetical protein